MFGWPKRNHDVIRVEMYDVESRKMFARSKMPIDRLPESFEADTTLHRPDGDWHVERAEPMTAAEFRKTGRLRLLMRRVKIEGADPKDVLYSLPTIDDVLPPIEPDTSKLNKNVLELHEDDWRQTEFVASSLLDAVEQEFADIRRIHEKQREGPGFRVLHVRKRLPAPLADRSVTVEALRSAFDPRMTWLDGIGLNRVAGLVAGGFAVKLFSSIELYGRLDEAAERAIALGVQNRTANNALASDLADLCRFMRKHDLILIDWCSCRKIAAGERELAEFFNPRSESA